ncbi:MAG: AAA family ATPase [Mediterraneibacter faecis]
MYESFFGMEHTPFVRDIPAEKLYEFDAFRETLGRLCYVADRQMFAVVTADPGCGKSTLIRRFYSELPREEYIILYLSDSKLTPRWFYKGMLDQLGLEARFYRGDSKRQLQQQIEIIHGVQHKKVVCVLDEGAPAGERNTGGIPFPSELQVRFCKSHGRRARRADRTVG